MKSTVAFFVVAIFGHVRPCQAEGELYLFSEAFGKKYEITVSDDVWAKSKWDGDTENPPISAKKAMSLAEKPRKLLAKERKGFKWSLSNLTLSPLEDSWYWVVSYRALPDNPDGDFTALHSIMVVVLMDGTVLAPTEVKDVEAPRESSNSK